MHVDSAQACKEHQLNNKSPVDVPKFHEAWMAKQRLAGHHGCGRGRSRCVGLRLLRRRCRWLQLHLTGRRHGGAEVA